MGGYSKIRDEDLAALLKEGNHVAYTELYDRYFQVLFVHAYKKLRDEELAKDLIQEFFTALWVKRENISLTGALSAYCFTSVNNRIIDHFLHERVNDRYISEALVTSAMDESKTDHRIRERQLMAFIEREIQALPPKMREIFELSRKSNYTYKQIADELDISEKTVHRQMVNALGRLRTKLGVVAFLYFLLKF